MRLSKIVGVGSLSFVLLATACKPKQGTTETGDGTEPNNTTVEATIPKVIVDKALDMNQANANFTVMDMTIKDDILKVIVNYSGGCKEHAFELFFNGVYAKSLPPQASLWMKHTNNDDMCRKLVVDTLEFDVSPVRYPGQQEVILRMNNTKQTVRYSYPK